MNYSKDRKDNEEFPKVMTKQDKDELISIIDILNSQSEPKDKIGINLQYRQVKIPINVMLSFKNRKNEYHKFLENEKNDKIISEYEENKSKEEQFNRRKAIEIENLTKNIKKLNCEESELQQEIDNISNNLINIKIKTDKIGKEKDRCKSNILKYEYDLNNLNQEVEKLQQENEEKIQRQERLRALDKYIEERKRLRDKEEILKNMLCYKCKSRLRNVFYSNCKHLALCRECYKENKSFDKRCPICLKVSEMVIKILSENMNY